MGRPARWHEPQRSARPHRSARRVAAMRLRLGVAGGPVPRDPADVDEALARQLAGLGLRVLTTHFQPSPEAVARHASRVKNVLAEHGLSIVQATGYNPQLTHPDDGVRSAE